MERIFSGAQEPAVIAAYEHGQSIRRIAKDHNVSAATVHGVLKRNDIPRRSGQTNAFFDDAAGSELRREYEQGQTLRELSRAHGTGPLTVRKALLRAGTTMRRAGNGVREFTAEQVAEMAEMWQAGSSQTAIGQRFGCSQVAVSRTLALHGLTVEHRRPRGSRHGSWTGGRHVNVHGYVMVYAERGDPIARALMSTTGYVAEHRLVMARHLGRPLTRSETVHHVNGDKQDNRIANLQMRQGKHGKGERFVCADCGSHNVVAEGI